MRPNGGQVIPVEAWRRAVGVVCLVTTVAVAVGCGTRVNNTPTTDAVGAVPPGDTTSGVAAPPDSDPVAANDVGTATSSAGDPSAGVDVPISKPGGQPQTLRPAAPAVKSPSGAQTSGGGSAGTAITSPASGPPDQTKPPSAATHTSKSPVVVGMAGTVSGPISVLKSWLQGTQLWVKWVNSRGGLNGHKVQLIVADDGGDPARHRAQLQDLVETRGVIAFLNNIELLSGSQSSVDYVNAKRVPVIGGTGGERVGPYQSPMYFPQQSTSSAFTSTLFASAAQQSLAKDKKKIGVLVCSELATCNELYKQADQQLRPRGMEVVFRAQASIAQPDYTAECLGARNAGAQVLFIVLDANSLRRIVSSCTRQGYRPLYFTGAQAVTDDMKGDPSLDGSLMANSSTFPWFQRGTPATAEYEAALRQFGQSIPPSGGVANSWAAGKLLERATANISEPPTAEAILQGLWTVAGDDLGGLTQPLRFSENKPAPPTVCWWNIAVMNGTWSSPNGFERSCE